MFVGDIIAGGFLLGGSSLVLLSKTIKTKIPREDAELIEKNGLYHFTSEDAAEKIIESGYIKPSNNIMSYGKKACFMFNGIPNVQNYVKNMVKEKI